MAVYPDIDNIELAKKIDLALDIIINEYLINQNSAPYPNFLFGFITEERKKDNSKYNLNLINSEIEAREVYRAMYYLGILWNEHPNTIVTDYGFYLYQNGGIEIRIKQENADRELSREVNKSVVKTNSIQRNILIVTLIVSAISLIISCLNYNKPNEQKLYVIPTTSMQDTVIIEGVPLNKDCDDSCQNIFKNKL